MYMPIMVMGRPLGCLADFASF